MKEEKNPSNTPNRLPWCPLFLFCYGVAGKPDAEFLEDFLVDFAEHHRGVHLAPFEQRQGVEGFLAVFVPKTEHGESYQHFIGVKAWVVAV